MLIDRKKIMLEEKRQRVIQLRSGNSFQGAVNSAAATPKKSKNREVKDQMPFFECKQLDSTWVWILYELLAPGFWTVRSQLFGFTISLVTPRETKAYVFFFPVVSWLSPGRSTRYLQLVSFGCK
jgi:hypothetical protein